MRGDLPPFDGQCYRRVQFNDAIIKEFYGGKVYGAATLLGQWIYWRKPPPTPPPPPAVTWSGMLNFWFLQL